MTTNRRPDRQKLLRRVAAGFGSLVLLLLVSATPAAAAAGQQPDQEGGSTTTSSAPAVPDQDIIPEPNSGQPPEDAGDRGGALQLAVLGLVVAGLGVIAWRIVVSARRHQTDTGASRSSPM